MKSTSTCVKAGTLTGMPSQYCACGKPATIIVRSKPLCAECFKALAVGRERT